MQTLAFIAIGISLITFAIVMVYRGHTPKDELWIRNMEGRVSEVETSISRINNEYEEIRTKLNDKTPPRT